MGVVKFWNAPLGAFVTFAGASVTDSGLGSSIHKSQNFEELVGLRDSENGRCQIWLPHLRPVNDDAQYHILCFRELSLVTFLICKARFAEFGN